MKRIILCIMLLILLAGCSPTHELTTTYNLNKDMQSGTVEGTVVYPKHSDEKYTLEDIKSRIDEFYNNYEKPIELNYSSKIENDKIIFNFGFEFSSIEDYKDKVDKLTEKDNKIEIEKSTNPFIYYEIINGFNYEMNAFIEKFEKDLENRKVFDESISLYLSTSSSTYIDGKKLEERFIDYPVNLKKSTEQLI